MVDNIVVGSQSNQSIKKPIRYLIPLNLQNIGQQVEVTVTIGNIALNIFFNLNNIIDNLFMSCYSLNKTTNYFWGYKCVFGNYINLIDSGCPFLFYFLDESNGQNYANNSQNINYDSLNNGVKLYAELR